MFTLNSVILKTEKGTSKIFALLALVLSLSAYIVYSWKTFIGETHPNISSWAVWSFLTILNFTSYKKLTGDWVKSILPTANAIMTIITLACALLTGSFKSLGGIDIACFIIGAIAGLAWWMTKSPDLTQFLLQASIIVGFIPTWKGTYGSPNSELWIAWLLWTLCFAFQFIAVKKNWSGNYLELLYPTSMFICHGIVFMMTV